MDFITGLPPSSHHSGTTAYDSILVIVDRYTKMAKYIPTKTTLTAAELATIFAERIAWEYGFPASIVTDRGSLFTSEFWSAFCFYTKVRRRLSTAFHPQTDGQTERQNQTLEQYLRSYCNYKQDDWVRWLPAAAFAYNRSTNAILRISPFEALMGYNPTFETSIEDNALGEGAKDVRERVESMANVRTHADKLWEHAAAAQAKYYNSKHTRRNFAVGEKVLLNAKNIKLQRPQKKLDHKFLGPFEVEELIGNQAYRLRLPIRYKALHPVFHVSLLEPYLQREGKEPAEPAAIQLEDGEEWEVEAILDDRIRRGTRQYWVKWIGYPESDNSWEPEENLENAQNLLTAYRRQTDAAPPVPTRRSHRRK